VEFTIPFNLECSRGKGIVIELAPDDFVVAGAGFKVDFRELERPPRDVQIVSLEEGTFEAGQWVRARRLDGDEFHVQLLEKCAISRVLLIRP
jgi:Domain of unknown function (DUF5597)